MAETETTGFIGLGQMGTALATNLLNANYKLRVWNRSSEKARPFAERGAVVVKTPADVLDSQTRMVITMLIDDGAVNAVVFGPGGFEERLHEGVIHVSMSTIAPVTAEALAVSHRRRGAGFVAAPVFGKPDAAAAAKLFICMSGDPNARARVAPVLAKLGQKTFDFGESPAAAPAIKLAGNFMIGAAIEAMAEAFTIAEKTGIPRQQAHELFSSTLFACPVYQNYGKMIASHHYEPAGAAPALIGKDLRLMLEHASRQLVPMPLASLVHQRLMATVAKGAKGVDWTAFAREVSIAAGLNVL